MRFAKLAGILLPLLGSPLANAQVIGGDVSINAEISLGGEPVGSVDVFYDQLSPYGVWVDEPRMGRVFIPDRDGFVPYTEGHWQYTDVGFVWISNEPFDWATAHYGRWALSPEYGRWVWLPDTEWGPAWVDWRETGDDFGWAPMAPQIAIEYGYEPPIEAWHYCPSVHIFDVNVVRYYEPRDRVIIVHRQARPIEHRRQIGRTQVVVGPRPETLRAHRVAVRPTKVEPRLVGRMSPTEQRAAVQRAQQRKQVVEQENRRRIEQKPKIREVEKTVVKQHPQVVKRDQPVPAPQPDRVRRDEPKPAPQPDRARRDEPRPQPDRVRRDEPKPKPQPQPDRVRRDEPKPPPPRAEPERRPAPQPERVRPEPQPPKQPPQADRREQPKQKPAKPDKREHPDKDKKKDDR